MICVNLAMIWSCSPLLPRIFVGRAAATFSRLMLTRHRHEGEPTRQKGYECSVHKGVPIGALVSLLGQSCSPRCCMRVLHATKQTPVQPGAGASRAEADPPASVLVPPGAAIVEDVHAAAVLAGTCLEACLFSRSLLSDSSSPPSLLAKDLAIKDGLGDLLHESLLL
jgi:hypothetical protein